MSAQPPLPPAAKKNIEIISKVEQQLLEKRSRIERLGERIAGFFGSLFFVVAHAIFFASWILLNSRFVGGAKHFDPYPFPFLTLVVGIEFIFLTTFVLINQKHQIRRTEQWAHLHLQLSMLTEQEVTKNMQMLAELARHAGVKSPAGDKELAEMTQPTSVAAVLGEIEKSREEGGTPPATIGKIRTMEVELLKDEEDEVKKPQG